MEINVGEGSKVATLKVEETEELATVEVTGNFRGYWRDVPRKDREGKPVTDSEGKPVVDRQFKMTRSVKRTSDGAIIRQAAWLSEADANKFGFVDGAKYRLRLSVGETMTASKGNDGSHADEYSFADPIVLEVIGA